MKQLRGLYAQTFFTFRTALVYLWYAWNSEECTVGRECTVGQFYCDLAKGWMRRWAVTNVQLAVPAHCALLRIVTKCWDISKYRLCLQVGLNKNTVCVAGMCSYSMQSCNTRREKNIWKKYHTYRSKDKTKSSTMTHLHSVFKLLHPIM